MKAEIIAIGSELLLGETIDTNSAYLARQLAAIGVSLFRKTVVGDNEERIAAAITDALGRADLVICSGGLGPTPDDVTREAVASALGHPLVFHQHLLDQIAARFSAFGRTMSESNRRQAYVPAGARIVENARGTAPAFIAADERGTVVVLPGVPHEMRYLWETAITPYLRDERGQTGVILVHTLHAAGLSESLAGELLADLMTQTNPTLGISAKRAQYELRIGARADSRTEAEALVAQAEAIIRERLGSYLIGDERLEQSVARLLAERGLTVALYEGNSYAPVYRALVSTPEGLASLRGAILHPLDIPADVEAAESLARAGAISARDRWAAHLALGVQPASEPEPDGYTTICVALSYRDTIRTWTGRHQLTFHEGWEFVGTLALNGLRRCLLDEA